MIWDKWIPAKYFVKPEVCSVEVCVNEEGKIYYYTHLRSKNKKLELVETGSNADSLFLPKGIIKNKIPFNLVVNGKGIILKKIMLNESKELGTEELIRQNLPAINLDDFYAQVYRQSDDSAFIVLCRRNQLDEIISELKSKKCNLAGVLLGIPAIIGLQPLSNSFNSIRTSTHLVELNNNVMDSVSSSSNLVKEKIRIEELSFDAEYTLGFSAGLSYLMQRQIVENNSGELRLIAEQHVERNKFRFLMFLVVGVAFIAAIVNVIFYTLYFDKNNKLEAELFVYQGKYEQINQLLKDYQENKTLIENAGVLSGNKLSEYADRIGKTLPDEVVLSELYFNPKKEDEESEDSLVTFQNKSLVLKGNCAKSFIVNEWINVLKMQRFIKDASLEKFVYNNQGMTPNFEIKLVTE